MPRLPRANPVALYLAELSPGSRRTMRFGLGVACRFFGGRDPDSFLWYGVRADQVSALRADLAERLAPNTANKILAAVKGVLKASWRLGLMSAEDLYRAIDVKPVRGGADASRAPNATVASARAAITAGTAPQRMTTARLPTKATASDTLSRPISPMRGSVRGPYASST